MNATSDFAPFFLGACGENNQDFEAIWLEFFRDHIYWRRNFHPKDVPPISPLDKHQADYLISQDTIKLELQQLSAALKQSVPINSPRYIGHMCSELLTPALLAQMITSLYNPNNVCLDVAPVTLNMELEVGKQLATMFGYSVDDTQPVCAWGHLTSGGTVANYESLWLYRSVKYFPLALYLAAQEETRLNICYQDTDILDWSVWELFNLSIDDVVVLRNQVLARIAAQPRAEQPELTALLKSKRIESQGPVDFFACFPGLKQPIVMVPITAHYSWEKAMKLLGLGTKQLWHIHVDEKMRVDAADLAAKLAQAQAEQRPVLAVVGVLGTTEYGTIDPIHHMLSARQQSQQAGLNFYLHVDAAWGGYISAMFRHQDSSLLPQQEIKARGDFDHFPSDDVYGAFAALGEVDSITVDPHKMGYIPYGCGAFIARNRAMSEFITQEAPYVFDNPDAIQDLTEKLHNLGQYIMEGSKPGAMAASAYVSHKVLPLHADKFGKLPAQTVKMAELFHQRIGEFAERVKDKVTVIVPMETDTNLICLAFNPVGNTNMADLNRFTRQLFEHLKVNADSPIQNNQFIGSYTSILRKSLRDEIADSLSAQLGIEPATFTEQVLDSRTQDDAIFVFRHTLMNPWLSDDKNGKNYIDLYLDYLAQLLLTPDA